MRREAAMTTYWIAQREDEVGGQVFKRGLGETIEDAEGDCFRRLIREEDDVAGQPFKRIVPIDEEHGTYRVELDTEDDVTGQYAKVKFLGQTKADVEGQGYRFGNLG